VTTVLPATEPTSSWHERCAVPSMWTVHAPHSPEVAIIKVNQWVEVGVELGDN
jgi:hypothetical protein